MCEHIGQNPKEIVNTSSRIHSKALDIGESVGYALDAAMRNVGDIDTKSNKETTGKTVKTV